MERVDYDYYFSEFGGNLIPAEQFRYYERKSAAYVNAMTCNRAVESELDVVRDCVCAIAELYYSHDNNDRVASESVGALTMSYREDQHPIEQKLSDVCRCYLMHTGLLYRGVVL